MFHLQPNDKCGFATKPHKLTLLSFCDVGIIDSTYVYNLCNVFSQLNIIESYSPIIFTYLSKYTPISQWKNSSIKKKKNIFY